MKIRFNQLRSNFPLLFKCAEEIYYDNNSGGLMPIWDKHSNSSYTEITFAFSELQLAENFLSKCTKEEMEAIYFGDEDQLEDTGITTRIGYDNVKQILDSFFEGDNCIFVISKAFNKFKRF